jgi:hypothetical protein
MILDNRIKLIERLRIQLQGHLYLGEEKRDGWKDTISLYMFKCPKHGYVKTYVKGFNKRLDCPECIEELKQFNKAYTQ